MPGSDRVRGAGVGVQGRADDQDVDERPDHEREDQVGRRDDGDDRRYLEEPCRGMAVDPEGLHARGAGQADDRGQHDDREQNDEEAASQQKAGQSDDPCVRVPQAELDGPAHPGQPAGSSRTSRLFPGELPRCVDHPGYGADGAGVPTTFWICPSSCPTMFISCW
jgi:hypothetical protein